MVNTEEFTNRLQKIIEYYDLSASSFADKIEVGRSSISHLLSGRNKPSLEFVMKIVKTFPEVELYWLLNGKGEFPKRDKAFQKKEENKTETRQQSTTATKNSDNDLFSESQENNNKEQKNTTPIIPNNGKKIARVIIFYEDGTFDAFEN
ncbi:MULTISPECIES: helix-turn-helix transcriptional regulator [unclassified Zunongwangia]|uniref:helix-turn-helix transcriptional regulator n=1 Tax=unclassified Zunongwangia TaxID=2632541 RepID=UPI0022DD3857|nr:MULTISPECIES: helix-turn-helix transcriptional regulator [unclassified Zunongwangia]WBL20803.1 helix-turn-helix transcriptional regulator [Zunongwangia sp. HRR-M8]WBL27320.1 helix-turn-helix transcriptional regulator [Zunongwangia sp. HGR-M22]